MKRIINAIFLILYFGISSYLVITLHEFLTITELLIITSFLGIIALLFIYLFKNNALLFLSYPCILFVLICLFIFNNQNNNLMSFVTNIKDDASNYILVIPAYKNITLNELENIGYYKKIVAFNNLETTYNSYCYNDINTLFDDLNTEVLDAIILPSNLNLDINKYKKLLDLSLIDEIIPVNKVVDNTSLIYVVGNDINIVLGFNKKSDQIVIISIPENYYVPFKNSNETISNINKYGVLESLKVVEELINYKINYYIKIDNDSMENLIDKIGDIKVYSNYNFVSYGFEFKKGLNLLNGKEASIFSSYDNPMIGGSRVKSENTIKVLESVIKKLFSKNNFLSHLDELESVIKTNIPENEMIDILKKEFIYKSEWNIVDYSLDGDDNYEYTYSSKCCKLSVMKPNMNTINNAITMIEYLKSDSVFN